MFLSKTVLLQRKTGLVLFYQLKYTRYFIYLLYFKYFYIYLFIYLIYFVITIIMDAIT